MFGKYSLKDRKVIDSEILMTSSIFQNIIINIATYDSFHQVA